MFQPVNIASLSAAKLTGDKSRWNNCLAEQQGLLKRRSRSLSHGPRNGAVFRVSDRCARPRRLRDTRSGWRHLVQCGC